MEIQQDQDSLIKQASVGACPMSLYIFGFIVQLCTLILASYNYHTFGIVFESVLILISLFMIIRYTNKCLKKSSWINFYCGKAPNRIFISIYSTIGVALVVLMFSIQCGVIINAPSLSKYSDFPSNCNTDVGCTRITLKNSNRGGGWMPLTILAADRDDLVQTYLENQPRTRLENGEQNLLHFTTTTKFWGFIDDTTIRYDFCDIEGTPYVTISAQAQLRIGSSDFGVNDDRLQDLYNHMNEKGDPISHN